MCQNQHFKKAIDNNDHQVLVGLLFIGKLVTELFAGFISDGEGGRDVNLLVEI